MLTAQEKQDIEAVADHYELKKAASIEALKIVQKHRGWVSDEALSDVARCAGDVADGPGCRGHLL